MYHSRNFTADMHSDIYDPVWFKLGIMIDTLELYIFILIYVALILIQGYRDVRM